MTARARAGALAVTLLALGATSGCAENLREVYAPECEGEAAEATLILIAQSVPSATLVPCIEVYPTGWTFVGAEVRSGRAEISFDHDRGGLGFLHVVLTEECDDEEATEIRSDEDDTERFEVTEQVVGDFRGAWYYHFEGGCVTYEFDFDDADSNLQIESAVAIGFVTRQRLADRLAETSDGHLEL